MSDVECQMLNVGCRMLDVECQVSSIKLNESKKKKKVGKVARIGGGGNLDNAQIEKFVPCDVFPKGSPQ